MTLSLTQQIQALKSNTVQDTADWIPAIVRGALPDWAVIFNGWAAQERARLAAMGWGIGATIPIDRPWNSDADSRRVKQMIDDAYVTWIWAYNESFGTALTPDARYLGADAQPNPYVPNGTLDPRPKGGWIEQNAGTLITIAAIAAAVYTGGASMGLFGAEAGGTAVVSSAAEIAAATGINMEAAAIYSAAGYSAADLGAAVALDIAAAGSVVSNVSSLQTFSQAYNTAQGTGGLMAGISPTADAMSLEALMAGNTAAISAPLATDAAIMGVGGATAGGGFFSNLWGGNMGTIFQDISGTVADIGGSIASVYGTVTGTQIQMAQLDLARAQAAAAAQQPTAFYQTTSGAIDWKMIGLAAVGLFGLAFAWKKFA